MSRSAATPSPLAVVGLLCVVAGQKCPEQTFAGVVLNVTYLPQPGEVLWPAGINRFEQPGKVTGALVDLYDMIAEKLGLKLNVLPARSEGIVNISRSPWTATVHEIGNGINDLSISGYY